MLDSLIYKIQAPFHNLYAIAVYKDEEGSQYQLIEFSYYKNDLKVVFSHKASSLDEVLDKMTKNHPVLLHIEGHDTINKTVKNRSNYKQDLIFKSNLNDFYFYEYIKDDQICVSIIRKDSVDDIMAKISERNRFVVNLTFGSYVLVNLSLIKTEEMELSTPINRVLIKDKTIKQVESNDLEIFENYRLNEEVYNSFELPLLASFLDYKFYSESNLKKEEFIINNKQQQIYKSRLLYFGSIALGLIIMLLISSHFLLQHQNQELLEKQEAHIIAQQNFKHVNSLKEALATKEKIFYSSGLSNHQYLTKYIADMSNLLIGKSSFNNIEVFPLKKKVNPSEKVDYLLNEITVTGESQNDSDFNLWTSELRQLDWVKKIEIREYNRESNKSNTFELNIKL